MVYIAVALHIAIFAFMGPLLAFGSLVTGDFENAKFLAIASVADWILIIFFQKLLRISSMQK